MVLLSDPASLPVRHAACPNLQLLEPRTQANDMGAS
jgi:hypothetical protein